jgi:formylglycine-generating enzyme
MPWHEPLEADVRVRIGALLIMSASQAMNTALTDSGACDGRKALAMDLIEIPAGEFWMGCETGRADENPVHRVYVDAFAMGSTTVTNQQYRLFADATGEALSPVVSGRCFNDPSQPVVAVTWFNAMAYCSWLSRETGLSFRLPTEAEWEWAIRDGRDKALYAWGNDPPDTLERYRTGWQEEGPQTVALDAPNRRGLYDLGDNVHEWCLDWYDPEYYSRAPRSNPVNLDATARRASRGGAWRHRVKVSRCAARSSLSPDFAYTDYGFRVVRGREIRMAE